MQSIHQAEVTFLWEEKRRRRLIALCADFSGSREAGEDLAQETLLEAWRNAHKLTEPEGADRWLAAIARNVCRRWLRAQTRSAPEVPAEPAALAAAGGIQEEPTHVELVEALDRALGMLPQETRSALVARYVDDLPHARIAEQLGVSEDAVAMRLSRAKASLRQLVDAGTAPDDRDSWLETRLWCTTCGRARISMLRGEGGGTLVFRCAGCDPDRAVTLSEFRLDNPTFARVVGSLKRPATIRDRLAQWALPYFLQATERAGAECTRCGANARVTGFSRPEVDRESAERRGLLVECPRCGEQVWLSLAGAALALPKTREFVREHPRVFVLPRREIDFRGTDAILVAYQDRFGHARVETIFQRDTLRVLDVRRAA